MKGNLVAGYLRVLFLVTVASMALGAAGVSVASAELTCSTTESCRVTLKPDGTGKTAHHVIIFKKGGASGALTCNSLSGEATKAKEATELTFTEPKYASCNVAGTAATVTTNGCDYLYAYSGSFSIKCPLESEMQVTAGTCAISIPPQGPLSGITYKELEPPVEGETTASTLVKGLSGAASANCKGLLGFSGAFSEGEYTTGNLIMESEADVPPPVLTCPTSFCRVTLKPDGTGKTAHHVIFFKKGAASGALTCNSLSGEATKAKEATELTFTEPEYAGCTLAGSAATVTTNGCDYLYAYSGSFSIKCPTGKEMQVTAGTCAISIPPQGPLSGITYKELEPPVEGETTASTLVKGLSGAASANCSGLLGFSGAFSEGEYTTGNLIMESEADE